MNKLLQKDRKHDSNIYENTDKINEKERPEASKNANGVQSRQSVKKLKNRCFKN